MTKLLNRVAEVFIDGRRFTHPPLSIDIDRHEAFNKFATTTVSLWNPNDETIGACDSRQDPLDAEQLVRPWMVVHAGYQPTSTERRKEVVALGFVTSHRVEEHGADRALVIDMEDTAKIETRGLKQEYRVPMSVSELLFRISTPNFTRIDPGDNKVLPRFAFSNELQAVRQLASTSSSVYWYRGGLLNVISNTLEPEGNPTLINEASGLLRAPKKLETGKDSERGYEFRTLFIPGYGLGRTTGVIDKNGKRLDGVIYETNTVFSTYGSNYQDHKMKAAA